MEGDTVLYLQLHKLSAIKSQEDLENLLTSLWKTRKTGLPPHLKSSLQSLLNLPSPGEVDPVLACLRSLMRKCVHENFTDGDILKLFPPDLSLDLQSNLILLFQKYQNQWKEEMSGEQHLLPRTSISHQVNAGLLPSVGSFLSSETFASLWPRQDVPFNRFSQNDIGASTRLTAETNASHAISIPLQRDVGPTDNLGILPRLKSMTWTLEIRKKTPTKRVAVISLKLQDYTNSPSGETEVKFQLTRDTLEAMLRSMTYISEQLSSLCLFFWESGFPINAL
ncbi:uncharacterized protein LOC131319314 isoform X2 [Rhododendron vialii]|uniref:uncharacterized protein LOC131319314 isoform X2 n=1 Tax=Rhododendron vialii TaxID=182163 RepID=UPI00265DCEC0|nr:uncharacterized protein LOC131319314 isoform X2 [Rhododendron vialii]